MADSQAFWMRGTLDIDGVPLVHLPMPTSSIDFSYGGLERFLQLLRIIVRYTVRSL
jgi:hypothetical protein